MVESNSKGHFMWWKITIVCDVETLMHNAC